jgi:hypothetical protein
MNAQELVRGPMSFSGHMICATGGALPSRSGPSSLSNAGLIEAIADQSPAVPSFTTRVYGFDFDNHRFCFCHAGRAWRPNLRSNFRSYRAAVLAEWRGLCSNQRTANMP